MWQKESSEVLSLWWGHSDFTDLRSRTPVLVARWTLLPPCFPEISHALSWKIHHLWDEAGHPALRDEEAEVQRIQRFTLEPASQTRRFLSEYYLLSTLSSAPYSFSTLSVLCPYLHPVWFGSGKRLTQKVFIKWKWGWNLGNGEHKEGIEVNIPKPRPGK